jgi:hypothetical protein
MSNSSALYIIPVLKCVCKVTIIISITVSVRISSDSDNSSSSNNKILVSQAIITCPLKILYGTLVTVNINFNASFDVTP